MESDDDTEEASGFRKRIKNNSNKKNISNKRNNNKRR